MIDKNILINFNKELNDCSDEKQLKELRDKYLAKKGLVQSLMAKMKDLTSAEKPLYGKLVNDLKEEITKKINDLNEEFEKAKLIRKLNSEKIDVSLDVFKPNIGDLHPLSIIINEIEDLFISLGYEIEYGPEVESDYYNFELANTPKGHPARDMQDTFYIDDNTLLRSHTTAIQTRVLANCKKLPLKVICPGKVYRNDEDATHSHQFTQIEGIVVAENVSLSDLKFTLQILADKILGKGRKIRFRPSYFPFTEPSFEVDVSCHKCNGEGCALCKDSGYIEVLGSGMVHPNVLEAAGIDSTKYSGFAFGLGVERIAMLKYGIDDIRHFYNNDLRFIKNFKRFE